MMNVLRRANWHLSWALLGILFATGCRPSEPTQVARPKITVPMSIDFRSSLPVIEVAVELEEGRSVLEALLMAGRQKGFLVEYTGKGETAFVAGIDQVTNLGADGDNWVYRVNDQLGDCSAGVRALKAGDKVNWTFGKYPE